MVRLPGHARCVEFGDVNVVFASDAERLTGCLEEDRADECHSHHPHRDHPQQGPLPALVMGYCEDTDRHRLDTPWLWLILLLLLHPHVYTAKAAGLLVFLLWHHYEEAGLWDQACLTPAGTAPPCHREPLLSLWC